MGGVDLLEGLDAAQLAAVTHPAGPVCVVARAGAGKTRVLTRRIAWRAEQGSLDIRRVAAITFTTRAADELRDRLGRLVGRDTGVVGTFHAVAWRIVRAHHDEQRTNAPTLLDDARGFLSGVVPADLRRSTNAIMGEITWARARRIAPDSYAEAALSARHTIGVDPGRIAEIAASYREHKRRRGVVDFDDLIDECTRRLTEDPGFARSQQWRFRHFFVDEYQDVNPLQQEFLAALLGDRDDLFVVGDPNQAIYGFNGADAAHLTDFTTHHPDAAVFSLTRNHRSPAGLVRLADAVFAQGNLRPEPSAEPAGTVEACRDEATEAVAIARAVRAEHAPGHRWDSQAVLVRTHAQAAVIVDTLERSGIPVTQEASWMSTDAVRVATFHSAKGLEWPVVHVAGLEEGFVPDIHATGAAAIAEEQRLLYVAMTRATRRVHLTWARRRRLGERLVNRSASRWLEPISQVIATPTPRAASGLASPSPAVTPDQAVTPGDAGKAGQAVAPDQTSDETLRDRLVEWRSRKARAASVPVGVVLSNAVIEELIRVSPSDPEELDTVQGLGPIKARRYGSELLDALHPGGTR